MRPGRKKTKAKSGGVEPELGADCLLDVGSWAAIVLGQLFYRFAGLVTLGDDRGCDARTRPNEM